MHLCTLALGIQAQALATNLFNSTPTQIIIKFQLLKRPLYNRPVHRVKLPPTFSTSFYLLYYWQMQYNLAKRSGKKMRQTSFRQEKDEYK